jgi:hypothetical protein
MFMPRSARIAGLLACLLFLIPFPTQSPVSAEGAQPYAVRESPVSVSPDLIEQRPLISGSLVVWGAAISAPRQMHGRRLPDGEVFTLSTAQPYTAYDLDGERLVTVELSDKGYGVYLYQIADSSRREIAPPNGADLGRREVQIAGNTIAWLEGSLRDKLWDVYAHDLSTGRTQAICTDPAQQDTLALSEQYVVWRDGRHNAEDQQFVWDIYAYDLATARESRVTAWSSLVGHLAISGHTVVCEAKMQRAAGSNYRTASILAYDLSTSRRRTLVEFESHPINVWVDVDGDLVVWSALMMWDQDIYGYDLRLGSPLAICSAIGDQYMPRIAGHSVVWLDARHRPLGEGAWNANIYGATLQPGDAPPPPVSGAPTAIDARIEVLWPHGGVSVSQAELANVAAYLFLPGTRRLPPCQWRPQVLLLGAQNNEVRGPVVASLRRDDAVAIWRADNISVGIARNPRNSLYLYLAVLDKAPGLVRTPDSAYISVTTQDTVTHSNVWAHASNALTFFPQQDTPTAVDDSADPSLVDARIEIVWPHGWARVSEADLVNVTAHLYLSGSLVSVSPKANPTIHLWRSLNNEPGEIVATGEKRLVTADSTTYPVWDFNNIDVSAARDPANKYYFRLSLDELPGGSNIWVHGLDARTYFPQQDMPEGSCGTSF